LAYYLFARFSDMAKLKVEHLEVEENPQPHLSVLLPTKNLPRYILLHFYPIGKSDSQELFQVTPAHHFFYVGTSYTR
jgi:hypothetical protein